MLKRLFLIATLAASPALAADKASEAPKVHTIQMSDEDIAIVAGGMNNVSRLCASTDDGAPFCQVAAAWNVIRKKWSAAIAAEPKSDTGKGAKTP